MATGGHEETSGEILNFKCTPCAKANKHREAVKYCVECQGYCCQSCVDMHKLFPALVAHKLLDKSNIKRTNLQTDLPSIPTDICSTHMVKIIDMYCEDHDEVGCSSCMTLNHRNCNGVKLISDTVDVIFKISNADEIDRKLQEQKLTLEKIKNLKDTFLQLLNKSKSDAIKSIRDFRKELETILEKLETESIKELEKEYKKVKSILEEQKKTADDVIDEIKQASSELRKAEGNKAQQFVSFKMAQKKITKADPILQSLNTQVNAKIQFSSNGEVRTFLQQLRNLGSVSRNTIYSVTGKGEMKIRMQNDNLTCRVYGCCLTEEGKMLLADYSNKKLKRADIVKRSLEDHCDLADNPCSVSCISKNEAAVSLENNTLQFVSIGNQMTPTRKLKLDHECFGIACTNEKLYITDNRNSLYIHDMTGTLLQTISRDGLGKEMFTRSRHIAFGDLSDKVFIADRVNKLIIIDNQGNITNSLNDSGLDNGTGVCTDKNGNVFVCGNDSKSIVQFSQNGTEINTVVKTAGELEGVWSLAFHPQLKTLCVTLHNSDTVKLFHLQ